MPLLVTENAKFSNLVKRELFSEQGYTRSTGTYNGTAGTIKIGTVLGVVTSTGKYKIAVQTAVDGSQTPAAIVLQDFTAVLNTDVPFVLTMTRGPAVVAQGALIVDASFTAGALLNGVYAAFEAKGIQVAPTV